MKRLLFSMPRTRMLFAAAVATLGIVAAAIAYFSSTGTSAGSASVGALTAPTISSATPGAGTVALNWTSVTPPSGGTVKYYVTRAGGTVGGNCPSSAATATTSLSCTDSGLTKGTYSYTVTALWHSWSATSVAANATVSTGAASQVVLSGATTNLASGTTRTFTATIEDAAGNTITTGPDSTDSITFAQTNSGSGAGSLTGLTSVAASGGVATDTVTGKLAGSVTLQASGNVGGTAVSSNSLTFSVINGTATQIVLSGSTASLASGTTRALTATIEDAAGNTVTTGPDSTDSITFAQTNSGSGAGSLTGLTSVPASGGVATDTVTGKLAGSVTVQATGTINAAATASNSLTFSVTAGSASQLAFTTQPDGSATGGLAFPTQPKVSIEDAAGNVVTSDSSTVTLSITSGTPASGGPGALSGCTQTETAGVVSFSGCSINTAGTGYKLHATDGSLTATDSAAFNVSVGPAAQLAFTTQPDGSATGGLAFPTQPKVAVEDAGGNVVTSDSSTVTLSITTGTPATGGPGTLSGCSQTETAGVVSFSGCSIDTAGTGYKLHATDGSLTATDSAAFNVSVGPAAKLVFTTQPDGSATAGSAFPTQPKVAVEDAGGNVVTSDSSTVSLSITTGTPATGGPGTLSGCTQIETAGVVSFSGCSINSGGTGYKLHATDGSLTATDSAAFDVTASTSVSVIGQGAAKSATINNVTSRNGATDLIVIYCYGGSACGSSGSVATVNTGAGTPFSSASTNTIQSIVFSGSTKTCLEIIQATGNGQTGTVTVSFSGGNTDTVGFVNVLQLSAGATVKSVGTNPASQTQSTTATATLGSTGSSEIAIVGLDGNNGADTITPPTGMTAITPLSGFSNPESNSTIGFAGGTMGMYFNPVAQATANFALNPTAVDWGTVALQVG